MRYQHHKFNISRLSNGNHQNLFTYNSYILRIDIVHWKHIWNTELLEDVKSMWHLFIHRFVLHLLTRLSLCQACFQCMMLMCKSMNLWMNKLHMIFIINSLYVNLWWGPWNEKTLSLTWMIRGLVTLEFLEKKKTWTCKHVVVMVELWQKKIATLKTIVH